MKYKNLILTTLVASSLTSVSLFAKSKTLNFSSNIEKVCGIEIVKSQGSIGFKDKASNSRALFVIKTNGSSDTAKVKFSNIKKSDNIQNEKGYFMVNGKKVNWDNPQVISANKNFGQDVGAFIDKNSSSIRAGEASISTTLEIECN